MKTIFHKILFIILIYSTSIFAQNLNSALIGEWESVTMVGQKVSHLKFSPDGKITMQQFIEADYKYKLKGNLLFQTFHTNFPISKTIIDTNYLTVKKDTIYRKYGKLYWSTTVKMVRDKSFKLSSKINPLVGKWLWKYPAGHIATSIYFNNGTMHLSVPRDKYFGNYSISGDTLKVTLGNKTTISSNIRIKGKLLIIKNIKTGNKEIYKRVK